MTKFLAAAAVFLAAVPARAAFEDGGYNPRGTAMGGALTALTDDPISAFVNPAGLGPLRHPQFQLNYLRQFDLPAGQANQDQLSGVAAIPIQQELIHGTFGVETLYTQEHKFADEREVGLSYGSRGAVETDGGGLDFGGSLKFLDKSYAAGGGTLHAALDLGALYRFQERYSLGLSIVNFGRPSFHVPNGGGVDRTPATIRVGLAETLRDFVMSADLVKREPSGTHPGTANLAAGVERWWAMRRYGAVAGRTGLSLGDRDKTWNWGLGWRMMGGEFDYAMTVPMQGPTNIGHAVSLTFRFGVSDPEAEYEKVFQDELRYRKELTAALQAGEVKQWQLGDELGKLREEMELLRKQLAEKTTSEAEARRRLGELELKHRLAQERYDRMQEQAKRLAERTQDQLYREDWRSYLRLKTGGAPDSVLTEDIRRILLQYKDKGVDLSGANQELVRLLRSR